MTTITLENVVKTYTLNIEGETQHIPAADNISLRIHPREILVLLGPSGCGKTTVLRLIAGLERPDSGQILYDNVSLDEIPREDRGIGMVFQQNALIPHWENRRTVGFFFELRERENELPERIQRIAQITGFGIETLLDRRPAQLSGGEQQRVGVARALARDLDILLFDEPFSNLDAKLRHQARIELKKLLHEFPATTVYVTHDQSEAMALADRIAIMHKGRIEQIGAYHHLYRTPVNLFVATFIGTPGINLFEGHVSEGQWQGHNFGPFPIRADLPEGKAVMLGIRPESIHLAQGGTPAVVERLTPFFEQRLQQIDVYLAGEYWTLTVPLSQEVKVGATVYCEFSPEGILYFDAESGQRIG